MSFPRPTAILTLVAASSLSAIALAGCSSPSSSQAAPGASTSTSATASASHAPVASPAAAQDLSAVPSTCPSAARVTSALGFKLTGLYPSSSAGSLSCEYYNLQKKANGAEVVFIPAHGISAASWVAKSQAAAPHGHVVSGIGEVAYFAPGPDHVTVLNVFDGSVVINMYAGPAPSQSRLEALAHVMLGA